MNVREKRNEVLGSRVVKALESRNMEAYYVKTKEEALEKALTPEQLRLVEDYKDACCGLRDLEDRLLFQEAVSLGKWMALP